MLEKTIDFFKEANDYGFVYSEICAEYWKDVIKDYRLLFIEISYGVHA